MEEGKHNSTENGEWERDRGREGERRGKRAERGKHNREEEEEEAMRGGETRGPEKFPWQ